MPTDDWERGFAEGWKAAEEWRFGRQMTEPGKSIVTKSKKKGKKKRKASAYNKRYAKEYRRLKKKHPRTSFAALAKKAHAATRKAMK